MSQRIHPIRTQGISRPTRTRVLVFLAIFLQSKTRIEIVVAHRMCRSKAKGLRTIYQQQLRYIQAHNLKCSPVELFDKDLAKQIKEWRKAGDRIVLVMDVNDNPLTSRFYQQLQKEQMGLEEFTHKCWGPTLPYTHILLQ